MNILKYADDLYEMVESAQSGVNAYLFEPSIRIGVTGLSRAGKTIFITALVQHLLNRGRIPALKAQAEGRITDAFLRPQRDMNIPRFEIEAHTAALSGETPVWPASTRSISQLRLTLRVRPDGFVNRYFGPRDVHLDIVDYPGEWLLDLTLLDQSYQAFSEQALAAARSQARADHAAPFLAALETVDPTAAFDETDAQTLARAFTAYLNSARESGLSGLAPGRFLLPGDLEGAPVLTFAPMTGSGGSRSLIKEMARRFDAYKRDVARPFFRDHFTRLDRQIVLVDLLGALSAGPAALEDLRQTMTDVLRAFRPGRATWLSSILTRRIDRILFAATKADHIHSSQHARLEAILTGLLREAEDRARLKGADTRALILAALRATTEQETTRNGRKLSLVRGLAQDTGEAIALHPGDLPQDPAHVVGHARGGAQTWRGGGFALTPFAPPPLTLKPGEGPPHIRLDRALDFLIGDAL